MIGAIGVTRKAIDADVEAAANICSSLVSHDAVADFDQRYRVGHVGEVPLVLVSDGYSPTWDNPLLFLPIADLPTFTSTDPLRADILPTFVRACLREAQDIWEGRFRERLDWRGDDVYYQRGWKKGDPLYEQTLVFVRYRGEDVDNHLMLVAFGRGVEGLPKSEDMTEEVDSSREGLERLIQRLPDLQLFTEHDTLTPFVYTLPQQVREPQWMDYEGWLRYLEGTIQELFIKSPLDRPQRVEGPAGSGKTLSLVLKCIHNLHKAKKDERSHHSLFLAFSNDTRTKIIENFFAILDADECFHKASRETDHQSVEVKTLLDWCIDELERLGEAGEIALPFRDAAQLRPHEHDVVGIVLEEHLSNLVATRGARFSSQFRGEVKRQIDNTLISMFAHEFGVVIKGMAEGRLEKYLEIERPRVALSCNTPADREAVFELFQHYQAWFETQDGREFDLNDVATSIQHKLKMPVLEPARKERAYDSIFLDEAHLFNPNELAVLMLLAREKFDGRALPIVFAVDLPQAIEDKGYADGRLELLLAVEPEPFEFPESYRCPQAILDVANRIYAQGREFFDALITPPTLRAPQDMADKERGERPALVICRDTARMVSKTAEVAKSLKNDLNCGRSDILIVLLREELKDLLPDSLINFSETLQRRTDADAEATARKKRKFIVGPPGYLHGLEYDGAIMVGATKGYVPRISMQETAGALALYDTQRTVNEIYLAITRARKQVVFLCDGEPSPLLEPAIRDGLVDKIVDGD